MSLRIHSLIIAVLALVIMLANSLLGAVARADEPSVMVSIDQISPLVLSSDGELVISGRVTNTTDTTIHQVDVTLWRDATELTTISELETVAGRTELGGLPMSTPDATHSVGSLAPGESIPFKVQASLAGAGSEPLYLSTPRAVYQVGVIATSGSGRGQEIGQARGYVINGGDARVGSSEVILLSHRPSVVRLNTSDGQPYFYDESLAQALQTDLEPLLDYGLANQTLIAVDPALYDEVVLLAEQGSDAASTWLANLDSAISAGLVMRTLYGNPDLASAMQVDAKSVLDSSLAALDAEHPLTELPLVVVPHDGVLSQNLLDLVKTAEPDLVIGADPSGSYLVAENGGQRVLAVTSTIPDAANQVTTATQQTSMHQAQQFLSGINGGQAVTLVTGAAELTAATPAGSWRFSEPLGNVLRHQIQGHYATDLESNPDLGDFSPAWQQSSQLLGVWSDLAGDQLAGADDAFVASAWSTAFRRDRGMQATWALAATGGIEQALHGGQIQLSISNWVTTSEEDNFLPATVTNNSSTSIQVRIHFESDNALRIAVADSELVTVAPKESLTVRVQPRTFSNGKVAVSAALHTPSGSEVCEPVEFVVTGTEAGKTTWVIIIASGAVLLAGTAWRVRSMRQERASGSEGK